MNDKHSDLTDHERRTLRSLEEGITPPGELEDRVVDALRARGHLQEPRPRWGWALPVLRWGAAAALLALVFWSGTIFERARSGEPDAPTPAIITAVDGGTQAGVVAPPPVTTPRVEPLVVRSSVDFLAYADYSDASERSGKYRNPVQVGPPRND